MTKRKTEQDLRQAAFHSEPDPSKNESEEAAHLDDGTGPDEQSYVHIEDVKLGDKLVVMGDEYDCLHDGEEREVLQNENGRLYVDCEEGKHWLDKGVDIHDYLIGLGSKV